MRIVPIVWDAAAKAHSAAQKQTPPILKIIRNRASPQKKACCCNNNDTDNSKSEKEEGSTRSTEARAREVGQVVGQVVDPIKGVGLAWPTDWNRRRHLDEGTRRTESCLGEVRFVWSSSPLVVKVHIKPRAFVCTVVG